MTRILQVRLVPFFSLIVSIMLISPCLSLGSSENSSKSAVVSDYGKLPLYFIENRGQVDAKAKFYQRVGGRTVFFTEEGVVFCSLADGPNGHVSTFRLNLLGSRKDVSIVAQGPQEARVNHFIGNDPGRWKTGVPTCSSIVYQEVYPGIDLKFYGAGDHLEFDFIVKPGADPSAIRLGYTGMDDIEITETGDLSIRFNDGFAVTQKKPLVYQDLNGERMERLTELRMEEECILPRPRMKNGLGEPESEAGDSIFNPRTRVCRFEVGSYDRAYPLIIDPVLVYSTYLGGSGYDYGTAIAVDSTGCAYVVGITASVDFPIQCPYQAFNRSIASGLSDIFITKLNAAGDGLVYSTYIGGDYDDWGYAIVVDSLGYAYATGFTTSTDFPLKDPIQGALGGGEGDQDAFVLKLDPTGGDLIYSTYLGGSVMDVGRGIAIDSQRCVYVTGYTWSEDFPTKMPFQEFRGQDLPDAFIAKINAAGDALVYSTYLGGSADPDERPRVLGQDIGLAIAVDESENAYVTGLTDSFDFPTRDAIQPNKSGRFSGFVTKLDAGGDKLVYSTFEGGSGEGDYTGGGIAVDSTGCAYVAGCSRPTKERHGAVYVRKYAPSGADLLYSISIDGTQFPFIAIDSHGYAYVTGWLRKPTDLPMKNPLQMPGGRSDAFVAKVSPDGSFLRYASPLGGSRHDDARGIAVDGSGNVYITGSTQSKDFPTNESYQPVHGGNDDAFVMKIANGAGPPVADFKASAAYGRAPFRVTFTDRTVGEVTGLLWDFGDGSTSTEQSPDRTYTHTYKRPGVYTVKLTATGPRGESTKTIEDCVKVYRIRVTVPNGGETWDAGSDQTIRWNHAGKFGDYVRIELVKGGTVVGTICPAAPIGSDGQGSFPWPVSPAITPGRGYKVKVTSTSKPIISDMSDRGFSIAAPPN